MCLLNYTIYVFIMTPYSHEPFTVFVLKCTIKCPYVLLHLSRSKRIMDV